MGSSLQDQLQLMCTVYTVLMDVKNQLYCTVHVNKLYIFSTVYVHCTVCTAGEEQTEINRESFNTL